MQGIWSVIAGCLVYAGQVYRPGSIDEKTVPKIVLA